MTHKTCTWCGAAMLNPRSNQTYCNAECRKLHKVQQKSRNDKPALISCNCEECDIEFQTDNKTKEFCSSKCQQDYNNFWKGQGPKLAKAMTTWRVGRKPGSFSAMTKAFSAARNAHKLRKQQKKELRK